jgi:hypothetical protein
MNSHFEYLFMFIFLVWLEPSFNLYCYSLSKVFLPIRNPFGHGSFCAHDKMKIDVMLEP